MKHFSSSFVLLSTLVLSARSQYGSSSSSSASVLTNSAGNSMSTMSGTPTINTVFTATQTGSAATVSPSVKLTPPPLIQCSYVQFAFVGPPLPKYFAVFPLGGQFVEQLALPDAYTNLTSGTFPWRVDLPVGMAVGFELYVKVDNAIPHDGSGSTSYPIVQAGSNSNCLVQNTDNVATSSILAIASSLDPAFTYGGALSQPTGAVIVGSSSSSPVNVGALAGGIVGGVVAIALLATLLWLLKRRHERRQAETGDGFSSYGNGSEKHHSQSHFGMIPGMMGAGDHLGQQPGYYSPAIQQFDEYGRPIMVGVGEDPGMRPIEEYNRNATAPLGTLPEPMDADEADNLQRRPTNPGQPHAVDNPASIHSPASPSPSSAFTPTTGAIAPTGHSGLDDPNSFAPAGRSRFGLGGGNTAEELADPGSFAAKGRSGRMVNDVDEE